MARNAGNQIIIMPISDEEKRLLKGVGKWALYSVCYVIGVIVVVLGTVILLYSFILGKLGSNQ